MTLFLNEFLKLYRRKPFMLLSAVLFVFGLLALFLYERNTEEYLRRNNQSKAYVQEKEEDESAYIAEYQVFLNEMSKRAEQIRNNNINTSNKSSEKVNYRILELDRTLSEYQKLKGIELVKGDYTAVNKYAAWLPGILVELLFLVILLYYVFFEEKDHNRYLLLRSTARGRSGLAASKLLVCFCSVLIFTLLYEAAVFLLLQVMYGSVDPNTPVQSASSFRNSPWKISILEMFALSYTLKSLVLCTVLSFLWILSVSFGKISLPVLMTSGTLGLQLLLWYLIRPEGTLRMFHLVNLFSLTDARESIGSFYLLNLFSNPVRADRMAVILACIALIVLSVGGIRIFSIKNQVRRETFIEKWMLKLRARLHVLQEGSSIFLLELYKVLIQEKKILLALVLVIYFISLFRGVYKQHMFATAGAAAYQFYAMQLQGEMDGSQEQIINEEEERLQSMREESQRLKEEPEDPENTMDVNNAFRAAQLDAEMEIYEPGLDLVREQVQKLMADIILDETDFTGNSETVLWEKPGQEKVRDLLEDENTFHKERMNPRKRYFINEDAYKKFYLDFRTRLFRWLVVVCSLILLTSGLYAVDEQSGMSSLIHSTERGREHLSHIRFGIMVLFMMILYLGTEIPTILQWYYIDGFKCYSAPFSDFVSYGFQTNLKIGTCMTVVSAIRLLSLLLFGAASLRLSKVLKNEMMTVVVLAGAAALIVIFGLIFSTDLAGLILRIVGVKFTR